MRDHLILFDVDNTLYDFVSLFGPAFRSMVHRLAKKYPFTEEELIEDFAAVYRRVGTIEYQFLLQETRAFGELSERELGIAIDDARIAFDVTRKKALGRTLYPGIAEILSDLTNAKATVVAVTNAPYYFLYGRLRDYKLLPYFRGILAWEGMPAPSDRPEQVEKYATAYDRLRRRTELFEVFPKGLCKPAPNMMDRALKHFAGFEKRFVVGDSLDKDLDPGKNLGFTTIFAEYGRNVNQKDLDTILRITPWSTGEIKGHRPQPADPDYIITSPEQLREIMKIPKSPKQADLFES